MPGGIQRHHPRRNSELLEGDPLSEELAFLPDLARLEWALREAFVAADARPLSWSDLQAAGEGAIADVPLHLVPGTRVVGSEWPLLQLWQLKDVDDADVDLSIERRSAHFLVSRRAYSAVPIEIDAARARLVAHAAAGGSLAALLEGASDAEEIGRTVEAFRGLVAWGVFSEETVPGGLAPASEQ